MLAYTYTTTVKGKDFLNSTKFALWRCSLAWGVILGGVRAQGTHFLKYPRFKLKFCFALGEIDFSEGISQRSFKKFTIYCLTLSRKLFTFTQLRTIQQVFLWQMWPFACFPSLILIVFLPLLFTLLLFLRLLSVSFVSSHGMSKNHPIEERCVLFVLLVIISYAISNCRTFKDSVTKKWSWIRIRNVLVGDNKCESGICNTWA